MVVLTVFGRIAGKGSRTIGRAKNGRAYTRPASKHEKPWVKAVADAALWRKTQGPVVEAPYAVWLDFYFQRGRRPKHGYPSSLDVDKAVRATLDGLVDGGLLSDDRHVVEVHATKQWATAEGGECCRVTICPPDTPMVRAA